MVRSPVVDVVPDDMPHDELLAMVAQAEAAAQDKSKGLTEFSFSMYRSLVGFSIDKSNRR